MFRLNYVDKEEDHVFLCETKMEALEKVKGFFADSAKNKPIAYELYDNDRLVIDAEGFEELEECFKFFKTNPEYGKAVDEKYAKYYQKEFN